MLTGSRTTAFGITLTIAIIGLTLSSCSSDTPSEPVPGTAAAYDAGVPIAWMNLQLELVQRTPGFTPPVASRAFGYAGLALYESVVPGIPVAASLQGQVNGLESASLPHPDLSQEWHWPLVANSALATITRKLFPEAPTELSDRIDALEDSISASFAEVEASVRTRSADHGESVAEAVYLYSMGDGGTEGFRHNFPSDYDPPTGPGMWVPTERRGGPPQSALQPYWGGNRPFVLPEANPNALLDPGAPPTYSTEVSSNFYREALEVYDTLKNLSEEERLIARFWADDPGTTCTPPGHSISILAQCLDETDKRLDFAARAYAMLGLAVSDAFISCWETKYRYNLVRPLTYIQENIDPNFSYEDLPVDTPPFPEYTSGHSVQSGAMLGVMEYLFGASFEFEDHTHDRLGLSARHFGSFRDAAEEAAISRLYGGIHYRAAIERGVAQGEGVAEAVLGLNWTD